MPGFGSDEGVNDAVLRQLAMITPTSSGAESVPTSVATVLDDRTAALVRVGALVATGAGHDAYERTVADALAAGATHDDVIGTLLAVSGTVGLIRIVSAATGLALALGYDIDAALEGCDPPTA